MLIEDSIIQNNSAYYGGGISSCYGHLVVRNSVVKDNWGRYSGAGIDVLSGSLVVENSIIQNNHAKYGRGIGAEKSYVVLRNCLIQYNTATIEGGGIGFYNSGVDMNDKTKNNCINNDAPKHPNIIYS